MDVRKKPAFQNFPLLEPSSVQAKIILAELCQKGYVEQQGENYVLCSTGQGCLDRNLSDLLTNATHQLLEELFIAHETGQSEQALALLDESRAVLLEAETPIELGFTERQRAYLLLCSGRNDEAARAEKAALDLLGPLLGPQLV